LMPFMENKIGISRKISNQKERRRLRNIIRALLPDGYGVIVRTSIATSLIPGILAVVQWALLAPQLPI